MEEARIRIDSSCIIMERWEHWRGLWTYFVMTLLIGVEILLTIATSIQRTHFLNKTANGAFIRGLYLAYLWLLNNSTNFPMFFKGLGFGLVAMSSTCAHRDKRSCCEYLPDLGS